MLYFRFLVLDSGASVRLRLSGREYFDRQELDGFSFTAERIEMLGKSTPPDRSRQLCNQLNRGRLFKFNLWSSSRCTFVVLCIYSPRSACRDIDNGHETSMIKCLFRLFR